MPELLRSEIENVRQSIEALDRRVTMLREADQKALSVALETLKERLALLNELRQVVVDQSRDFARVPQVEQQFESIKKGVDTLEKVVENLRTETTTRATSTTEARTMIIGGVSLIVAVVVGAVALFSFLGK